MITAGQPITYQGLLAQHERIRIPRLQRDFAQGRKGPKETDVRNTFLDVLHDTLVRASDPAFTPLNLDFVYGNVEKVPTTHFSLLDGQQRLTTLFLLHWVLAWRDGDESWKHFTEVFRESGGHSRFSYHVRTSSREFFNVLVAHRPSHLETQAPGFDLKEWVTDQPWYFQYWRLDPTVQGVLEMLRAMHRHALFQVRPGDLYRQLTDAARPVITFQLLDLGEFPRADDLYIKMNARGKPLTAFETFKARYESKLAGHFSSNARRTIGSASFPVAEFVSRRLDTAWTDFFWSFHRETDSFDPKRVDEAFMNLFRMVALVTRNPDQATVSYTADIDLLRSQNPPTYSAFDTRSWLDADFSAAVVSLMESWCIGGMPLCSGGSFDEVGLLRQLFKDAASLTVPQTVLFSGYTLFIQKHEGHFESAELGEWMRVVHNLGYNSEIDRTDRVQSAAKGLRELLARSKGILSHVASLHNHAPVTGFAREQQREEAIKAGLLLADPAGWRPLIHGAESHGYFRGQIGFLLNFAGVTAEWEKTGNCAWPLPLHADYQNAFRSYLAKAEAMFDTAGLADLGEERWQRALLSLGDYLLPNGVANHSLLVNDVSKPFSWKRLLRDDNPRRDLLKQLWDRVTLREPLAPQLDAIIEASSDMEPWREALVRNVETIRYCSRRNIQRGDGNHVILLRKERLSAPHAELFTFVLDSRLTPPSPFTKGDYHERAVPHIPLLFEWRGEQRCLELRGLDGHFELRLKLPMVDQLTTLLERRGAFEQEGSPPEWLVRRTDSANLTATLTAIGELLLNS